MATISTKSAKPKPQEQVFADVFLTGVGTIEGKGLVKSGRHTIRVEAFSSAWMKPATQGDAKKIAAHQRKVAAVSKVGAVAAKAQAHDNGLSDRIESLENDASGMGDAISLLMEQVKALEEFMYSLTPDNAESDAPEGKDQAPEQRKEPSEQQSS